MTTAVAVFEACVKAIRDNRLIRRSSRQDKEFHFQNWFQERLDEMSVNYDSPGRNTYPDFRFVHHPEGFELKGLAYPGRDANYDCNSQVPRGIHNERTVFYVFGRYPKEPDGDTYPVLDLVICHGGFLNADSSYIHKNKSFRGFGSYGDILVRDRKMYVAPTPYALASGTAHMRTLILPAELEVSASLRLVGTFERRETSHFVGVPAQREMESEPLPLVSIPPCGRGFSRHGGLPIRCDFGMSAKGFFRARLHRLDEPARLSLGMVASPQCPLPFRLAEPL